jgi:hypothetical protein
VELEFSSARGLTRFPRPGMDLTRRTLPDVTCGCNVTAGP